MKGLLTIAMSTRNVLNVPGRPERCTEFQLHGDSCGTNVIDFTEKKLISLSERTKDPQQKAVLVQLIEDYRNGLTAVAWRRGSPVPLRVTKEG